MNTHANNVFLEAVQAFNSGQVQLASLRATEIPLLDSSVARDSDYNQLVGAIAQAFGKTKLAVEHLLLAHHEAPRRTDIIERLAHLLLQIGDLRGAGYYLLKSQSLARYAGHEDVLVFGDSHSEHFFSGIPRCKVNWLGPMTMHRVGRDGLAAVNVQALSIRHGDTVRAAVFVFGEIDVRAHVTEQRDRVGRKLDEVIATLCANYVRTACLNRDLIAGISVVICSVPPPMVCENNPDVPFGSSIDERAALTRQINDTLKSLCVENGLLFLDIYPYFSDPSGVMTRGVSDNTVHVRREFSDIVEYELGKIIAPIQR